MDNLDQISRIKSRIEVFIEKGYLAEARALLDELELITSNDPEVYSMQAVIEITKGNLDEAEKLLCQGLYYRSNNFDLLYNMAFIYEKKNKLQDALEFYLRAKKISNESQSRIIDSTLMKLNMLSKMDYVKEYYKTLRVLHGMKEIANQMFTLSRGLRNLGIHAETYEFYPSYLGYQSDFIYNLLEINDEAKRKQDINEIVQRSINGYDIFHFHFGTSFSPDNMDLQALVDAGKKVYMHHWGSDVRLHSKAAKISKYVKVKTTDEELIKNKMNFFSKHIDTCIVGDYELYEYVKDYYNKTVVIPVAVNLDELAIAEAKGNDKLLVVHAPTSQYIKGTEYILKAVEELKINYDFEFKLVYNMSNECAKEIYRQADIIIDQLLIGCYGVFAVESMALGKPVITWISEFMREKYPPDLPIVSANPDNIKQQLEILIKDKQLRIDLGLKGRKYVENHHNMSDVCRKLLDVYQS